MNHVLVTSNLFYHSHRCLLMPGENVMQIDDKLPNLGYMERNKRKPGLYSKRLQHCTAYLDHRDIGGKSIEEQQQEGPMFYAFPYDGQPAWQCGREAALEQSRLAENTVKYRVSIISKDPLVGEFGYEDGFCKACHKDFQSDGVWCSDACRRILETNMSARRQGGPVMDVMRTLGID